jgi:hypothetical protein
MKITTLIDAANIFGQFAQTKTSPPLAYKIMKFCKGVAVEEEFYNAKRSEIINAYAEKDESGQIVVHDGMISIMPDKIEEANKALGELNKIEVEVPNIKFKLSELEGFELSVADMFALDEFIEE